MKLQVETSSRSFALAENGFQLAYEFNQGDVDVEEAETAEGAAEVATHPHGSEIWGMHGYPVQIP